MVIKLGLHNTPPLMLAACAMLVAFPALLFVARPAIPLRLLLGYGLTINFRPVCLFCSALSAWACRRRAGVAGAAGANLYHHSWRLRLWRTQGKQLAGIALAIFGVLVLVEEPRREHVPLVGFMLTWRRRSTGPPAAIFSTKNHVPGDPPIIISLVVWSALIPCCRLCLPRG